MDYLKDEHICGRPLGLRFDKRSGDLYIADAYFGIMKVGPQGGLATSLTTEADGVPLRFTNDLDVDDQGNVYFTDSSSVFQRRYVCMGSTTLNSVRVGEACEMSFLKSFALYSPGNCKCLCCWWLAWILVLFAYHVLLLSCLD